MTSPAGRRTMLSTAQSRVLIVEPTSPTWQIDTRCISDRAARHVGQGREGSSLPASCMCARGDTDEEVSFFPDPSRKTVNIPVRVRNGAIVQADDPPLPDIADGALGDLVLPEWTIQDKIQLEALQRHTVIRLLTADSSIWIGLSPESMQHTKTPPLCRPDRLLSRFLFAEALLENDLNLLIRGTKAAQLQPCRVHIPALRTTAESVNHAFTLLSTEFETRRMSHTGIVFTRVYTKIDNSWRSLDDLRLVVV